MNHLNAAIIALSTSLLCACAPSGPGQTADNEPDEINQAKLCEVNAWQNDVVKAACEPGQTVVFLPHSLENEQLPVIFADVNRDLRYNVALTNGGVTCIFSPVMCEEEAPSAQPDSPSTS